MLKSRGKRSSRPSRPHPLFSKRSTAAPCRSVHPEASLASLDPQSSQVAQKRAETASTRYRQAARASSTLPADMSFTSLPAIPPYAARGEPCKAHRTTGERAARSSRSTFSSFQERRHSDSLRCKIEAGEPCVLIFPAVVTHRLICMLKRLVCQNFLPAVPQTGNQNPSRQVF